MARKRNFLLSHHYLRFHLWLRHRCERLTIRQRKEIVYGLSFIYLLCSLWMIAQFFLPPKKEKLPIPTGKWDGQSDTDRQYFYKSYTAIFTYNIIKQSKKNG